MRTYAVELRPAQQTDFEAITHIWREQRVIQAQTDVRLAIKPGELEAWQQKIQCMIDGECDGLVIVALQDDKTVGFIAGEYESNTTPIIHDLALDAHKYHGGLGRKLVAALRDWFRSNGLQEMIVCVPRHHAVVQAFWRSLGAIEANTERECSAGYVWLKL